MKRQRVAAIIIKDKKILLVRDGKADFFSLPGGCIEDDENHVTALARELDEEIGCTLKESQYYYAFDLINQTYNVPQTDYVYIVLISGDPVCSSEVCELGWFSKEDIACNEVKTPPAFFEKLYPKLVEENLL